MPLLPEKRTEDVVVVDTKDEVLVYDLKREKAHHLNRAAAIVWRHCDGRTETATAAQAIAKELGTSQDEELVAYALERLDRARLLKGPLPEVYALAGLTRRELLKRAALLGLAAALIPAIVSLVPPSAAQAAGTCVQNTSCTGQLDGTPCFKTDMANGCTVCSCWSGICRKNSNHNANCNT